MSEITSCHILHFLAYENTFPRSNLLSVWILRPAQISIRMWIHFLRFRIKTSIQLISRCGSYPFSDPPYVPFFTLFSRRLIPFFNLFRTLPHGFSSIQHNPFCSDSIKPNSEISDSLCKSNFFSNPFPKFILLILKSFFISSHIYPF